jgi:hypothetical protein
MFWSNENHCGAMSGGDLLVSGGTDNDGRLSVPDGDFEYAFELLDPHVRFSSPNARDTTGYVIANLTSRETDMWVHVSSSRPLDLSVFAGKSPLAGVVFSGSINGCGSCRVCNGPVGAATDRAGTLAIDPFYPDDFDNLCLIGDDGAVLWHAVTRRLGLGPVEIHLPEGTAPPTRTGECPSGP